jgi:hypothetical protein
VVFLVTSQLPRATSRYLDIDNTFAARYFVIHELKYMNQCMQNKPRQKLSFYSNYVIKRNGPPPSMSALSGLDLMNT